MYSTYSYFLLRKLKCAFSPKVIQIEIFHIHVRIASTKEYAKFERRGKIRNKESSLLLLYNREIESCG